MGSTVLDGRTEYEEIIDRLEEEKKHMNKLMEQSSIREMIDTDFVNQLMIDIRKKTIRDVTTPTASQQTVVAIPASVYPLMLQASEGSPLV